MVANASSEIDADDWEDDGDDAFMREFRAKRLQGESIASAWGV